MMNVLKLLSFVVFVGLGLRARNDRRAVQHLALYVVALSAAVLATNRDAWPFATYPLVPTRYREEQLSRKLEYRGVDANGVEHPVDVEAFAPVYPLATDIWFEKSYSSLPKQQQDEAMLFLGRRAEAARAALANGERIGSHRLLGAAAAPDWWRYPAAPRVSTPFRVLRVYRVEWKAGELYRDPHGYRRTLVAERVLMQDGAGP